MYPLLMSHLERVHQDQSTFGDGSKEAGKIQNFWTSKNVMAFHVFNLDVQRVFSAESLTSQEKGSSIIGKK